MLISTISHDDEDTQGSSEILDSLGLTGTGRAGGRTSVEHTQSLSQGNVTTIGQCSDTETFLSSQELMGVHTVPISDGDHAIIDVLFPVDSGLFLPFEVTDVLTLEFHGDISMMHVDSDDSLDLLSFDRRAEVFQTHASEEFHHLLDFSSLGLHGAFLVLGGSFETFGQFLGPHGLHSDQSDLRSVALDEVFHLRDVDVGALRTGHSNDVLESFLHFVL